MITFYETPKFPSSDCSYDMQIWPLSFAPCLTHLFFPPLYGSHHCRVSENEVGNDSDFEFGLFRIEGSNCTGLSHHAYIY